jgi:hypothetical protein
MSANTIRIVTVLLLISHGAGHTMGILSAAGMKLSSSSSPKSWLLTRIVGDKPSRIFAVALWTFATLGFLATGLSLLDFLIPASNWETIALVSAGFSMLGLFLFWNAFASWFNKLGAISVNLAILGSLLWLRWPPELFTL